MEKIRQVLAIYGGGESQSRPLITTLKESGISVDSLSASNIDHLEGIDSSIPKILFVDQSTPSSIIDSCTKKCEFINLLLVEPSVLAARPELYEVAIEIVIAPCDIEEILIRIERSMTLLCQNSSAVSNQEKKIHKNLVGKSQEYFSIIEQIKRYANIDAPVLIAGETGTGKELVARALHYSSDRKAQPFQALNCGALPDSLIESELFGHARGAFTDAKESFRGLIAMAEGGTLFLDEIDSLSHKAQTALLRFLQDGQYRSVGSSKSIKTDVRIISATNANLDKLADEKQFRRDLIFRLNTLPLNLPPLRHRRSDILLLAEHFLAQCAREHGKGKKIFHLALKKKLIDYLWPGNIRELENYVKRAYLLTDQAVIGMLPDGSYSMHNSLDTSIESVDCDEALQGGYLNPLEDSALKLSGDESSRSHEVSPSDVVPVFAEAKKAVIDNFEVSYIRQLLKYTHGNVSRAAKLAGKERRVFGRLMKKHHIEKSVFVAS
ncbi:sigma-54 interaction domain-containing protein [Aurantivibrio plasticivorans]